MSGPGERRTVVPLGAKRGLGTVAICTAGRSSLLRTLGALEEDASGAIAKVLIVDNSIDGDCVRAAASLCQRLPIQVIDGDPLLSRARNLAVRAAKTELVAFIDDDCVPASGWASELFTFMDEMPRLAAAFGRVEPSTMPGARIRVVPVEEVGTVAWGEADTPFGRRWCPAITAPCWPAGVAEQPTAPWARVGSSNNMAIRRSLLLEGREPFLSTLGAGSPACSGEDTEFGYALMAAGRAVAHAPKALVFHDKWLGDEAADSARRGYFRGNVAALGMHSNSGDERAGTILLRYLRHFCDVNGFGGLSEVFQWAYAPDPGDGSREAALGRTHRK